ncbi:uncharacterized protein LACBIDRAFT_327526 [Laccaria bicolor S238N-H82]|uniref:Predicted protein n=1 Tax=Laccaria bicolor (strain S238N-H82 / ATCC MYA-4686) TaxID=486041 RepID=B0DC06_LACBS|nr:uncharacterized protein LACBIDRAFT_327526 [Laccaria bicolor S238N-H82]EDR07812.1 predicted protein [Laccaria bicolor S238N-H82]|eukprot:XP_001881601.1 predicted protein [Laccaria bicolor S238N-H82]
MLAIILEIQAMVIACDRCGAINAPDEGALMAQELTARQASFESRTEHLPHYVFLRKSCAIVTVLFRELGNQKRRSIRIDIITNFALLGSVVVVACVALLAWCSGAREQAGGKLEYTAPYFLNDNQYRSGPLI